MSSNCISNYLEKGWAEEAEWGGNKPRIADE